MTSASAAPPTDPALKVRFSVMMFLQYFVQGAYLPVVILFVEQGLEFSPRESGWFKAALAIGPLVAPFIIGQIVDRHLSTERVLAFSHLISGGLMLGIYLLALNWTPAFFWLVLVLGICYSALYVPSMMLTNSLAFHHLHDREAEFPLIRLWGTIGFIVPAWFVELVILKGLTGAELNERRGVILLVSGLAGLVMGAYCFTLPHTPPAKSDRKDLAPGKVLELLREQHFRVLVLMSLLIGVAHSYFFLWNSPYLRSILDQGHVGEAWEQRVSSIGQIAEIAVMAMLGFAVKRYGFKTTMLVGATAYVLRFVIFAAAIAVPAPFWLVMSWVCVGQALHGFCFGCFLAAAYMFVDRVASKDVRGSMQTFFGTFVVGLGMFVGGFVGGEIGEAFTTKPDEPTVRSQLGIASDAGMTQFVQQKTQDGRTTAETNIRDWPGIWLSGALIAGVALAGMAVYFSKDDGASRIGIVESDGGRAENTGAAFR